MKRIPTFFFLLLTAGTFAQLNSYRYKRKLEPVIKEGYYSIPLLPEITANCQNDLSDLRIYNISGSDTTEAPYLLNMLGDRIGETAIPFELINDVTHLKCCSFVTLKMNRQTVINRINLDIAERNFDKIVVIEGSNDNRQWFTIKKHVRISGFSNGESTFRSGIISFPAAEYRYFRIKFDDDGSARVTVTAAYAFEYKITKGNYDELYIKSRQQTEDKKNKVSEVIVDLAHNYHISRLSLQSDNNTDFYRRIDIFRSGGIYHTPKGDEELWQQVGSGMISSADDNLFAFDDLQTRRLKIKISNYDDRPLTFDHVKVYSEKIALTAQLPAGEELYLAYGKENADAPVYDLLHFKNKIPENLTSLKYGKEETKPAAAAPEAGAAITGKTWLWIAMGAVILLIGYFAFSMLKKETEKRESD